MKEGGKRNEKLEGKGDSHEKKIRAKKKNLLKFATSHCTRE